MEPRPAWVVRRSRAAFATMLGSIAAAALGVAAVPFTNHAEQGTPMLVAYASSLTWLVAAACWFGWYRARSEETTLEVRTHEGAARLVVGGVPQRVFRRGTASRLPDGTARVELRRGLAALRVHLPSLEAARSLLGALGLDRRAGTSTFRVRSLVVTPVTTLVSAVAAFLAFVAFVVGAMPVVVVGLALPLVIWGALAAVSLRTLTVGADGLELRGVFRGSFVPHAGIARVYRVDARGRPFEQDDRSVSPGFVVELTSGRRLLVDSRIERFEANAWQTDAIHDAVASACAAARDEPANAAAFLGRGTRSTREWVAALRAAATHGSSYRTATPDARALEAVLVDAGAAREQRVGAAVALAAMDAPRLRVVADEVADPVVRRVAIAVEHGIPSEGDELVELEAELERAADARAPSPRRRM